MTDLTAFLRARLDEDEQVALDAMPARWEVRGRSVYVADGPPSLNPVARDAWDYAAHIARHDPARVLREVEAGRKRLDRHRPSYSDVCLCCQHRWPCPDIRDDLAVYSDHPDYRQEWKP